VCHSAPWCRDRADGAANAPQRVLRQGDRHGDVIDRSQHVLSHRWHGPKSRRVRVVDKA